MTLSTSELDAQIRRILSDVSAVPADEIHAEDSLAGDLGMDSVASLELLGMLDEAFGIELELEEAESITHVSQVLEIARTRVPVVS